MSKVTIEVTVTEIKKLLPRLSTEEILKLDEEIHEYLETHMMMSVAQTSFKEWEDKEEDGTFLERDFGKRRIQGDTRHVAFENLGRAKRAWLIRKKQHLLRFWHGQFSPTCGVLLRFALLRRQLARSTDYGKLPELSSLSPELPNWCYFF